MSEATTCPFCESELSSTAKKCRHCGEWVARDCLECGTPIRNEWAARGYCADCEETRRVGSLDLVSALGGQVPTHHRPYRSRGVALALALILGGLGAHKFYLGRPGLGTLYLLFFWTTIPLLAGLAEGAWYAAMSEEEFQQRFQEGRI